MYFTRTEHYTAAVAAVAVERLALVFPCILRSPLVVEYPSIVYVRMTAAEDVASIRMR